MAITRQEIEHIAVLARLDSTGGIFDKLAEDMQGIVAKTPSTKTFPSSPLPPTNSSHPTPPPSKPAASACPES